MRFLRGLIALPFVMAAAGLYMLSLLILPAFIVFVVFFIFGTDTPIFDWTLLICVVWVAYEWHEFLTRGRRSSRRRRR
jgi:hypothetical protein